MQFRNCVRLFKEELRKKKVAQIIVICAGLMLAISLCSSRKTAVIFRAGIKIHYIHPGTRISIYHCNFVQISSKKY